MLSCELANNTEPALVDWRWRALASGSGPSDCVRCCTVVLVLCAVLCSCSWGGSGAARAACTARRGARRAAAGGVMLVL
jgi:hypothetical protein